MISVIVMISVIKERCSGTCRCDTQFSNTKVSNKEGAGVVDAGFCYKVASLGYNMEFNSPPNCTSFAQGVYCSYSGKPFRIACTWSVISNDSNNTTNITNFDMAIYKGNTKVAESKAPTNSSTSPNTNYEIIELSPSTLSYYGAGNYTVYISRNGSYYGSENVKIGLAWAQS